MISTAVGNSHYALEHPFMEPWSMTSPAMVRSAMMNPVEFVRALSHKT